MNKVTALAIFLIHTAVLQAVEYRLPFEGRWFVLQGGDTLNVNQHMRVRAQRFGIDFMKVGGKTGRELTRGRGKSVEDFFSWGQTVLSPVDGEVVSAVATFPDNPLGTRDTKNPGGNYVVIKAAEDRYVFLAHMQNGSIKVKAGDRVKRGELLGLCGNSGNTDAPHIHMHVQDTPTLNVGEGQNTYFRGISVQLSGKQLHEVDWPLIRGLFVSQSESTGSDQRA